MKEKEHYISLSFKGGNAYHQNGKQLKLTDRIVNIGETIDCDVRYDSNGFTPEYYASIVKDSVNNKGSCASSCSVRHSFQHTR